MQIDHKGNEFKTLGEMLEFWGTTNGRYKRLLSKGATKEEALTTPKVSPSDAGKMGRSASGWGRGNEILLGRSKNG